MSDIVEELRSVCETGCDPDLPFEAADLIEKLRAENEKLAKLLAQEREWQWQSRKTLVAHLSAALKVANGETEP